MTDYKAKESKDPVLEDSEVHRFGDFPELERCVEWPGCVSSYGYGVFHRKRKEVLAHRAAWEKANGPIPNGLHVLHTCDNRLCINPRHLFTGTNLDNIADRVRKNRSARLIGELNNANKLSTEEVLGVFAMVALGYSQESVGKQFGITQSMVSRIVRRVAWRHL